MERLLLASVWAVVAVFGAISHRLDYTPPEPVETVLEFSAVLPPQTTHPTLVPPVPAEPVYRHGDCWWLPDMARRAGWADEDIPRLTQIVLRESGCCPNRRGGDRVDKNCVITRVTEWDHRSDTGLLQINGVHWKPDHPQYAGLVCKRMGICTQEPLLDAYTNLVAGRLLFEVAGWQPWTPIKRKSN